MVDRMECPGASGASESPVPKPEGRTLAEDFDPPKSFNSDDLLLAHDTAGDLLNVTGTLDIVKKLDTDHLWPMSS